jgi:tetratricopeptide (TPR) repeat protein
MYAMEADKKDAIPVGTSIAPATAGVIDLFDAIPKWAIYAVLALTAIIFSRALHNDFVNIDDDAFILKNPLIRNFSWEGVKAVFTNFQNGKYQPLVNLSYLREYNCFGFNPVAFHFTNIALHVASTWVVYRFAERLSGRQVTALITAVLFGIHPMHVEEVAWAAERKDVLYALFYLLALLYYVKYLSSGFQWKQYLLVFLFFVAAIFSKSTAMTLPLIMLATDIYTGRKMNLRAWLEKIPFVLLAVLFAVISIMSGGDMVAKLPDTINFMNRVFLFTSIPAFYILKLIAPFGLSVMHYYPDVTDGLLPWEYYASLPFLLFWVWLAIKRSSLRKEIIFGAAFFAITISVMEQLVAVGPSFTPERYSYIPYIGLFYIIGQLLANLPPGKRKIPISIFGGFLLLFCAQTWARIGVWNNSDSVFKDAVQKNASVTRDADFYFMEGNVRAGEGNVQGAIEDFGVCVSMKPGYAEAYTNRGAMYFRSGDMKSALRDFNMSLQLNPKRAKVYEDRAALEATTGDFDAALKDYDHFLKIDSNDSRGYADRGMVRITLKDTAGACNDWKKSVALGNKEAANYLGQFCR